MKRNYIIYIILVFLIIVFILMTLGNPVFLIGAIVCGMILYMYHEITLTPGERHERSRRRVEKEHLRRVEREGEAWAHGSKMGSYRAKQKIRMKEELMNPSFGKRRR